MLVHRLRRRPNIKSTSVPLSVRACVVEVVHRICIHLIFTCVSVSTDQVFPPVFSAHLRKTNFKHITDIIYIPHCVHSHSHVQALSRTIGGRATSIPITLCSDDMAAKSSMFEFE